MADSTYTFDVIAVGDTTQDIFLQMTDASVQCDIDGHNCRLCFDYAEKIAVDAKTDISAVGNAANNAIGVARLGLRSAIYSIVGDDEQGRLSQEVFEENKVDTRYLAFDKKHGTNLSMVINFKTERTIFVYHEPRIYKLPDLELSKWIYLTSASGEGVRTLHGQVLAYLSQHPEVSLAFNPGTYQIKLGLEELQPLFQRTQLLFLNTEESMRILGVKTRDIPKLMKSFHALGVKWMVITDGPKGAYFSDGASLSFQGIFDGPVVERTGAGDAYGSGFLSAIIHGKTAVEAMCWGDANSTSVVGYVGAREGLLTQDKLETLIKNNNSILPQPYDSTHH